MRTELFWLLSFGGFAAMSLLCGILVWPQLVAAWPSIEEAIDRFRRLPPLAKLVLMLFVGAFVVYGSTKTNLVDQTSGTNMVEIVEGGTNDVDVVEGGTNDVIIVEGGTNDVGEIDFEGGTNEVEIADGDTTNTPPMMLMMAMPFFGDQPPAVTPEDIARGWQLWEVRTNCNISYTMPEDATLATNWWVRGAYEDVKLFDFGSWRFPFSTNEYSSLWAFTWGKVRFELGNTNTEIVAVGAPMSAVPYRSRLWSAADTNDSRFVTWENFALNRDTNTPVNAQIELAANGDFTTRSNRVETVYRRVDPDDWDGDGYRNEDDGDPYNWDDGAEWYYGPMNDLPAGCNEDAYYSVSVRVAGDHTAWVSFEGDGPSDLSDPCFYAKPNDVYEVSLLIGKTYDVTCDAPIEFVGASDADVEVDNTLSGGFSVVWPVVISDEPIPTPQPRLLLGSGGSSSKGDGNFSLWVSPSWLDGVFHWSTNNCCHIVENGWPFDFTCGSSNCGCGGCDLSGSYTYEGYTIYYGGIRCGCHYESHDQTTFGLTLPTVVFKDGALRSMSVSFHHGDDDEPEAGTLTLRQTAGSGKIRVWEDADKTYEVTGDQSWDVSSFSGASFYIEGVETSARVEDITFRLTWDRPGGTSADDTKKMTCAEVEKVNVESSVCGASDNPPPFDGQMPHDFDVTQSLPPDQHAVVFYKDVVNEHDFSVYDFGVDIELQVKPVGAPVGRSSWFKLDPSPASGSVVYLSDLRGRLLNPKEGGVYHIGAAFSGSRTNECNIVLPLAGGSLDGILEADLARADRFAQSANEKYSRFRRNTPWFGYDWFFRGANGDYAGRPDNTDRPTVWQYNQVDDDSGLYGVGTLSGRSIRVAKLSNLIVAYVCEKIGVIKESQDLSRVLLGRLDGISAAESWKCGNDLAHGTNLVEAVDRLVDAVWREHDDKTSKLWPNLAPVDDWSAVPADAWTPGMDMRDYNYKFFSPGMLYKEP